ncbi:hypothetical protein [Ktedonobacter racemifer]|uniref:Uncharacterized protein n=1 Tax=Ktedonobacter racemifer DSM 44963 TaxID=485913 RepID=D6U8U6_KTERA|nr:hypothetical protein [Ktedonobacter racemifer]EFH79656.1 hypothetical protein Krac_0134 [Ktedonobacter racemifer DSM 44963]
MKMLNSKIIMRNCEYVGEKCAELGLNVKLLLVGGAYMLLLMGNRPTTHDVDVVVILDQPTEAENRQHYRDVKAVIAAVTKERGLPNAWLNDDVTTITDQVGTPRNARLWKRFGGLYIYVPEPAYMLALKLFSARPRDDRDIQALAEKLHVSTQAQAWTVLQRHINPRFLADREHQKKVQKALKRNFKE